MPLDNSQSVIQALNNAQAILFDFDGIVLDSEWPIFQSWQNLFEREGHELAQHLYVNCIGSDFEAWSPPNYLEELTGKQYDWEKEHTTRHVSIMRDLSEAQAMPGVEDLAKHLSHKPTAVVSSSSHKWVDGWLEKLNLTHHFNSTVCRGDAPRIKPAPDLFLEAARRLNIHPSECLVIEDSINGMHAAHQADMKVLAIPNRLTHILDFSAADWQHPTLEGLL